MTHPELTIQPLTDADREWVQTFIREHWGAEMVVAHGDLFRPHDLPGFRAEMGGKTVGLLTYRIDGDACEIITLDATVERRGIGTALLDAVCAETVTASCKRLWLITTNDNLDALRFYQRRGFQIVAVRPNAIEESRRLKPSVPLTGAYGIPLRDELELERVLAVDDPDCWMESDEGW